MNELKSFNPGFVVKESYNVGMMNWRLNWIRYVLLLLVMIAVGFVLIQFLPDVPSDDHEQTDTPARATSPSPPELTPTPVPTPDPVTAYVKQMSLRERVESLLILHTPGTDPAALSQFVQQFHPGGLILMEDNVPATVAQMHDMTTAVQALAGNYPLLLTIDEEGCTVKRLAADTFGCAPELKDQPASASLTAFQQRSALLKQVGVNLNFGVVADITGDPQSFIFPRVFGVDPQATGERVAEAVKGSHPDTLITLKHFPGHGETEANSHTTIPQVSVSQDVWSRTDAVPFEDGIKAGADMVMFGHLTYTSVDAVPATLSKKWHDILRQQLGFSGAIITDDMVMLLQSGDPQYTDPVQDAVSGLQAGNTMLLWVTDHGQGKSQVDVNGLIDGIVLAVQQGQLPESMIDRDAEQVLRLRAGLISR